VLVLSASLRAEVQNLEKATSLKESAKEMINKLDGKQEKQVNDLVGTEVKKTFAEAIEAIEKDDSLSEEEISNKTADLRNKEDIGNLKNRIYAFSGEAGLTASQGLRLKRDISELLHRKVGLLYLVDLKDNIKRFKEMHEKKKGEIVAPIIAKLIIDLDQEIKEREAAGEQLALSDNPFEKKVELLTIFKSAYGSCPTSRTLRTYLDKEVMYIDFYNKQIDERKKSELTEEEMEKDGSFLNEEQIQQGIDLSIANIDHLLNSCGPKFVAEEKALELLDSNRKEYKADELSGNINEIAKELNSSLNSFKKYEPHTKTESN
jgi:hypothetical protein